MSFQPILDRYKGLKTEWDSLFLAPSYRVSAETLYPLQANGLVSPSQTQPLNDLKQNSCSDADESFEQWKEVDPGPYAPLPRQNEQPQTLKKWLCRKRSDETSFFRFLT
jgi:hypothetical protein